MKKLLFLILIAFIDTSSAMRSFKAPNSFLEARKAINTAFEIEENNHLFIITITRTPNEHPTKLISNDEFEQVLKILYASCAGKTTGLHVYDGSSSDLSLTPKTQKASFDARYAKDIEDICKSLADFYTTNSMNAHSKIVVFNEMFFSQDKPLSFVQKNFILEEIKKMSVSSKKSAYLANFLYKEKRQVTNNKAHQDFSKMTTMFSTEAHSGFKKMHMNSQAYYLGCQAKMNLIPHTEAQTTLDYLINETNTIWSGIPITQYKKSTYCAESDNDILNGCLYEFGDGLTKPLGNTGIVNKVRNVFINNVIIEICYDLFCGVRKSNDWKHDGITHNPHNIHIVQSNSINPYGDSSQTPHDNVNRLPINTGILHADPYSNSYSQFGSLFFVEDNHPNPRIVKDILCFRTLFSVAFGDNMYTIAIYKI